MSKSEADAVCNRHEILELRGCGDGYYIPRGRDAHEPWLNQGSANCQLHSAMRAIAFDSQFSDTLLGVKLDSRNPQFAPLPRNVFVAFKHETIRGIPSRL